jgi:hypothetical protein
MMMAPLRTSTEKLGKLSCARVDITNEKRSGKMANAILGL